MVDIIQFLKDQRKAELDQLVGFPTIDHQVEIVSTTVEVGRAIIETTGDTVPRTPLTRTTAANCTSSPLQEMLQVQLSETSTTSWTVTSDAEFTQEVEFNVEGDVLVAGGSAGAASPHRSASRSPGPIPRTGPSPCPSRSRSLSHPRSAA